MTSSYISEPQVKTLVILGTIRFIIVRAVLFCQFQVIFMSSMPPYPPIAPIVLTSNDKLSIVDDLLNTLNSRLPVNAALSISYEFEPIGQQELPTNSEVHLYRVCGQQVTRKTQLPDLKRKIQDLERADKNSKANKLLSNGPNLMPSNTILSDNPNGILSLQTTAQDLLPTKPTLGSLSELPEQFRYFTELIKCFRCGKVGHLNYACPVDSKCFFCLSSQHNSERCPQKVVCYRCYEYGHINSDCKYRQAPPWCKYCRREHPGSCAFLTKHVKGTDHIKQLFNCDYLSNNSHIRCLRCFNYGHINCTNVRHD